MDGAWSWVYLDADANPMSGPALPTTAYPTQSDAESWVGQTWQDLVELGVDAVSLYEGDSLVYGPMSLRPA
jgi:hypothetical protein